VRATVVLISRNAAAVSSRLAACCSVRRDRSSAAWLISAAPDRMPVTLPPIMASVEFSVPTAWL
jgi:hypothetical protein